MRGILLSDADDNNVVSSILYNNTIDMRVFFADSNTLLDNLFLDSINVSLLLTEGTGNTITNATIKTTSVDVEYSGRVKLNITTVIPLNETESIPLDSIISITFSEEPLNKTNVENNFTINRDVNGTFFWDENTLTFTPSLNFDYNTTYNVSIDNMEDNVGNKIKEKILPINPERK